MLSNTIVLSVILAVMLLILGFVANTNWKLMKKTDESYTIDLPRSGERIEPKFLYTKEPLSNHTVSGQDFNETYNSLNEKREKKMKTINPWSVGTSMKMREEYAKNPKHKVRFGGFIGPKPK